MKQKRLTKIKLHGYKSIKECDLKLKELNVLIGPNGAGKSNFLGFFRLIRHMQEGGLQVFVGKQGGPDALFHFGRKTTKYILVELHFGSQAYSFHLQPTQDNQLIIADEFISTGHFNYESIGSGHFETETKTLRQKKHSFQKFFKEIVITMKNWHLYHFQDTSESSKIKQLQGINDNLYLRPDGSNLAAYLYFLKNANSIEFERIVKTVRLIAPFFGDFILRPYTHNKDLIELEWKEKHNDTPWKAHILSDGTLRFICLVTLLLQPAKYQPETIIIDEPELGLHPYAINLLGGILRSTSKKCQIIVSTQSTDLLSCFSPENVIVMDRINGLSSFRRLSETELDNWLEEYSLGELWKTNIIGGRP